MSDQIWFVGRDGQRFGPYSTQQLQEMAASQRLGPTDLIWCPGQTEWKPASTMSNIFPMPVRTDGAFMAGPPSVPNATVRESITRPNARPSSGGGIKIAIAAGIGVVVVGLIAFAIVSVMPRNKTDEKVAEGKPADKTETVHEVKRPAPVETIPPVTPTPTPQPVPQPVPQPTPIPQPTPMPVSPPITPPTPTPPPVIVPPPGPTVDPGVPNVGPAAPKYRAIGGALFVESTTRAAKLGEAAKNINSYGYIDGISIIAGWLTPTNNAITSNSSMSNFILPLNANTDYMFLAAADDYAQSLDLELFDNVDGRRVASDQTNHPEAVITYTPTANKNYRIRATMVRSKNNDSCMVSILMMKRNGWTVPFNNLDTAAKSLQGALESLHAQVVPTSFKGVDIRMAPNHFPVMGGVIAQGRDISMNNIGLGVGERFIIASGDKFASNFNIDLLNQSGISTLQTTNQGITPIMRFQANGSGYGLRTTNTRSNGATLSLTAIINTW